MSVSILFHGHSTLEMTSGEHRLIVDPFLDQNPLADVKAGAIQTQHILLSHAHFDHTADAEAIARKNNATVYCNVEMSQYYEKRGIQVVGLNQGGSVKTPFGRVALTIAFHTSTFADGSNGGVACGWIIEIGGKRIYFAGDTALFGDMALIGRIWKPDVAILPIGDHYTMGPTDALMAAEMIGARLVMPIHYNTFPPIKQDAAAFADALRTKGLTPVVLPPGGKFEI